MSIVHCRSRSRQRLPAVMATNALWLRVVVILVQRVCVSGVGLVGMLLLLLLSFLLMSRRPLCVRTERLSSAYHQRPHCVPIRYA